MMKKILLPLGVVLWASLMNAQVGVNTQNPQGAFHVDGNKDNNISGTPSAAQQSNDFVVASSGNVGIGITSPGRKLDIKSTTTPALRIEDGTQQTGYVLMSDANGNGQWKALTQSIIGSFPATGYTGPVEQYTNIWTNISITLPPGKWLILTNILLKANPSPTNGNGAWVRLQWSSTPNAANTTNITGSLNSGIYVAPYGLASGSSIINNTSTSNATYYLNLAGTNVFSNGSGGPVYSGTWDNLGASIWGENSIIAYPAN
ncbi:hypothetical protein ACTJIV_19235 [Chryseobacterium sp. 22532]|uniref:hypothetical protein n=1 Tax=Chryseobacterium sp. 22532 TaxID=3453938 RepID=UPI003F870FFE